MNGKWLFLCVFIPFLGLSQPKESGHSERIEGRQNAEWALNKPYVVMISLDGFRHDYAEKFQATNLLKIEEEGSGSSKLLSVFPSNTFPNHYTIVTGLYTENHGLLNNSFYNRKRGEKYSIYDRDAVGNGDWYGGMPLWSLAESQGMLSATYFWVGSEAEIAGFRPNYSYAYNPKTGNEERFDKVIEWLSLDPKERPHLILIYISVVDHDGHDYGPDAAETKKAVLEVDQLLGGFKEDLSELDLPVSLVLVSDHGMTHTNQALKLSDYTDLGDSKVINGVPAMIYNEDQEECDRIFNDLTKVPELTLYKKDNLPERFHFYNEDKTGDLLIMTDPPYFITSSGRISFKGGHGYDPALEDMGGIFYTIGPAFKDGKKIKPFENIHIYPMITHILGLETPEIDGNIKVLKSILK